MSEHKNDGSVRAMIHNAMSVPYFAVDVVRAIECISEAILRAEVPVENLFSNYIVHDLLSNNLKDLNKSLAI